MQNKHRFWSVYPRLLIIFLCLSSAQFAFAQVDPDETIEESDWVSEDSISENLSDSIQFYYEEGEVFIPGMLPEYDFYAFWDTLHADAYRFDMRKLKEGISLAILEPDCNFAMPVYGRTNSPFGWRRGGAHTGIDLQLRTGDSVFAAFDGVVRMSRYYSGYGNCVVLRHFNGLETLYGHLSKLLLTSGMLVNAGQVIGLGGSTGHSTGPHLHFEIRFLGRPLNPALLIDFLEETIKSDTFVIEPIVFVLPYTKYTKKKRRFYKNRRSRYRNKRH
ncbi:MAG: M23 family metallopeptidase [Flavobacteriaceae bacterium]|nr:M23 family metallopeptidase [Flavobacteriaceae bacterium]